jgi:hypothetical protein
MCFLYLHLPASKTDSFRLDVSSNPCFTVELVKRYLEIHPHLNLQVSLSIRRNQQPFSREFVVQELQRFAPVAGLPGHFTRHSFAGELPLGLSTEHSRGRYSSLRLLAAALHRETLRCEPVVSCPFYWKPKGHRYRHRHSGHGAATSNPS